jgi:hypothetical protein
MNGGKLDTKKQSRTDGAALAASENNHFRH